MFNPWTGQQPDLQVGTWIGAQGWKEMSRGAVGVSPGVLCLSPASIVPPNTELKDWARWQMVFVIQTCWWMFFFSLKTFNPHLELLPVASLDNRALSLKRSQNYFSKSAPIVLMLIMLTKPPNRGQIMLVTKLILWQQALDGGELWKQKSGSFPEFRVLFFFFSHVPDFLLW